LDQEGVGKIENLHYGILHCLFNRFFAGLKDSWIWPGIKEVGEFIGTHLISGMIPAFLIAGAIAVFLDKERITRLMGPKANPWLAYFTASFSGAILTVCSCGVIPIFTGILQRGAGIGPAFTFLFSSPAINLIALTYTQTFMGGKVALGRVISVIIGSIVIGLCMRFCFKGEEEESTPQASFMSMDDVQRTNLQIFLFFAMLIFIMLTSTGVFDRYTETLFVGLTFPFLSPIQAATVKKLIPKIAFLFLEALVLLIMLKKWFHRDEAIQWLKKSWSLFVMIFPKVLLGIFISGILAALLPLVSLIQTFTQNSLEANFIASLVGSMMYFGTIVGVNIVATLNHLGMHLGPCMTLLLSGPAVSLPSILALIPIVGRKKATVYLIFVIMTTTFSGIIFGWLTEI